jgi:uncharacterized protein (DUF58 family)
MSLVRLGTAFPLGLVAARRDFLAPASVVVWPARGRLKRGLLLGGAVETSRSAPSPSSGGQDEFFGLREYRSGDNPRWIAWRRSAARPTPVVREMARPLPEVLIVVLDTFCRGAGADPAIREKLIRFAGTLIDHALSRGYLVGLALGRKDGATFHRPAPGRGQLCALLDALADVEERVEATLEAALACIGAPAARSAIVVVVTPDPDWQPGGAGKKAIPFGCRRLLVVHPRNLDEFFEDDPLVARPQGITNGE